MSKKEKSKYIVGLYKDDQVLLEAVQKIRKRGIEIATVFTPFPVHHLDHHLGYKESRLPNAAFIFGAIGTITALALQIGLYGFNWPVNVGGKSHIPLPSFIPITFELTVLIGALGMVGTYMYLNKLAPGLQYQDIVDPRQTDDTFVVCIPAGENEEANRLIYQAFTDTGAFESREQELNIIHHYR